MLTFSDKFRFWAKVLEFKLPPRLSRATAPLFGIDNPYNRRDDELQSLFFHVPKTAGSSIRKAMWDRKAYHIPASRYFAYDSVKFDSYFKFCIARNPWARLYSAYSYLYKAAGRDPSFRDHRWSAVYLGDTKGFDDFVRRLEDESYCYSIKKYIHFRDQLDWIAYRNPSVHSGHILAPDYIVKYENIAESFEVICDRLGMATTLPVLRSGDSTDYRSVFNSRMVDTVARIYRRDIDALEYSFE